MLAPNIDISRSDSYRSDDIDISRAKTFKDTFSERAQKMDTQAEAEFFYHISNRIKNLETENIHMIQNEESLFSFWVKQWREERGATSSLTEIATCPSYLKIIGMGEKALPLVLNQLKSEGGNPDHWYIALESITGEDPVPEEAYGDTVKIAEAWLQWAEEKNVW